jgi:uncharacterized surface protein with fasciclin (FAS1) repeats
MTSITSRTLAAAGAVVAVVGLAACGDDDAATAELPSMSATASAGASAAASAGASAGAQAPAMDPTAELVGAGCADYNAAVPEGAGSVAGMAQTPLGTAAANNPLLRTLTMAVSGKVNPEVNMMATLNAGQFTVFAPTDEAFGKIPPAMLTTATKDAATLKKVLTYHVIKGQLSPDQIKGMHKTLEGDTVTVTGSGDTLKVNGTSVICGGVKTANATIYMIDGVLLPKG